MNNYGTGRMYTAEEVKASRENKGILAPAPEQWPTFKLKAYINEFTLAPDTLSKEALLTLAGQLQRYGGVFYMGLAREVRQWLYAHFELAQGAYNKDKG